MIHGFYELNQIPMISNSLSIKQLFDLNLSGVKFDHFVPSFNLITFSYIEGVLCQGGELIPGEAKRTPQ